MVAAAHAQGKRAGLRRDSLRPPAYNPRLGEYPIDHQEGDPTMTFDNWTGKAVLVALTGFGLTLLAIIIAALYDPFLISLNWVVAAFLVFSGVSYALFREKGVL